MILLPMMALAAWSPAPQACDISGILPLSASQVSSTYGIKASEDAGSVAMSGSSLKITGSVYGAPGCPATITSARLARADDSGGDAFFSEMSIDADLLPEILNRPVSFGVCPDPSTISEIRFSKGMFRSDKDLSVGEDSLERLTAFSGSLSFSASDECLSLSTIDARGMGSSGLSGSAAAIDSFSADLRAIPEDGEIFIPSVGLSGLSVFSPDGSVSLRVGSFRASAQDPGNVDIALRNAWVVPSDILPADVASHFPEGAVTMDLSAKLSSLQEGDTYRRSFLLSFASPEIAKLSASADFSSSGLDAESAMTGTLSRADLSLSDNGFSGIYESYSGSAFGDLSEVAAKLGGMIPEKVISGVSEWIGNLEKSSASVSIAPDAPLSVPQIMLAMKFSPDSLADIMGLSHENVPVTE